MSLKKLSNVSIALSIGLCTLALSGCAPARRNAPNPNAPRFTQQGYVNPNNVAPGNPNLMGYNTGNLMGNTGSYRNITGGTTQAPHATATNSSARADNIRTKLTQMGEITQPNVLVMGNTCLVGAKPSSGNADVSATKRAVVDRVKQIDPSISNVVVSEAPDMISRIGRLANDVKNNRPAQEISSEFTKLLQEAAPTVR